MTHPDATIVTAAFASEEHAERAIAFLTSHLEGRIVTTTAATDERRAGGMAIVDFRVDRSAEGRVECLLRGVHGIVIEQPAEGAGSIAV